MSEQTRLSPVDCAVGYPHHHWLVESDSDNNKICFLAKPDRDFLGKSRNFYIPASYFWIRSPSELVLSFYWNGNFSCEVFRDYNWQANCRSFVKGLNIPTWYYWKDALKGIRPRLMGNRRSQSISEAQPPHEELWTWPSLFEANARFKSENDDDVSRLGN